VVGFPDQTLKVDSGVMKSVWGKFSVLLVLAAFVVAKASFWLAMLPGGFSQSIIDPAFPANPAEVSNPCACTGAAVCKCGPGGCCETESPTQMVKNENESQIHSPSLCGRLSQGAGPVGEMPAVTAPLEFCQLLPLVSRPVCLVIVDLLVGRTDRPAAPPPKV